MKNTEIYISHADASRLEKFEKFVPAQTLAGTIFQCGI